MTVTEKTLRNFKFELPSTDIREFVVTEELVNNSDVELEKIRQAAKHAKKLGLGVNAGHGLNYQNLKEFMVIEEIDEVSIGHSVISRAVFVGLEQAVKEMIKITSGK